MKAGPRAHGLLTSLWTLPRIAQVAQQKTGWGGFPIHCIDACARLGRNKGDPHETAAPRRIFAYL